jgi:arginase
MVQSEQTRPLLVVGAPVDGSGTGRGESRAPARLRAVGLVERLAARDFGDLDVAVQDPRRDPQAGIVGYREVVIASRVIRDAVASMLAAGWRPLVLGGCCSILPGALAGVRRYLGPIGLAFVDGHLDLFDGRTSSTGEIAGMDLAIVIGHGPAALTGLDGEIPIVDPGDVVAVGDGDRPRRVSFRAPEPAEMAPELRVIDARALERDGSAATAERVLRELGGGSAPFWLHLDLDVIDGGEMPAVSFPVATDLGWEEVRALVAPLARSPRLIGMSVTDYNVDLDPDGALATRVADLLVAVLDPAGGA